MNDIEGTQQGGEAAAAKPSRIGHYRWVICGLIFFATTLNYVDRFTISVLKPTLAHEFGWTELDYSHVVVYFSLAYGIGYVFFGRTIDWLGAKIGYSIAVIIWTGAHIGCALIGSLTGFQISQFALGLGQSGNFPAALKTVAEWFPQRERALATGLFNAGTNLGAIVTPIVVPIITIMFGWRWAFVATGSLSLIWLFVWWAIYRNPRTHPKLSKEELAYIESDKQPPVKSLPWLKVLPMKETWGFAIAKFLTDPVWWFYLFWLPSIFAKKFGLDLKNFGPPLIAIYLISDLGSIAGGWLSSTLIKHGRSVNFSRKITMLICGLIVLPVMFSMEINNEWIVVAIIGIAAAAHQAFSANLFTIPSDIVPKVAVGSVVGIGGTAGAAGGVVIAWLTGEVLHYTNSYTPILVLAGTMYLIALAILHFMSPKLEQAKL